MGPAIIVLIAMDYLTCDQRLPGRGKDNGKPGRGKRSIVLFKKILGGEGAEGPTKKASEACTGGQDTRTRQKRAVLLWPTFAPPKIKSL